MRLIVIDSQREEYNKNHHYNKDSSKWDSWILHIPNMNKIEGGRIKVIS